MIIMQQSNVLQGKSVPWHSCGWYFDIWHPHLNIIADQVNSPMALALIMAVSCKMKDPLPMSPCQVPQDPLMSPVHILTDQSSFGCISMTHTISDNKYSL